MIINTNLIFFRLLFFLRFRWTGCPMIERISMDGDISSRQVILCNVLTDTWPVGLSIGKFTNSQGLSRYL